jgi:hypothetical protein
MALVSSPSDVFSAEAFIETGAIARGAGVEARWLPAVRGLAGDARKAYELVVARRGGSLDAVLARAEARDKTEQPVARFAEQEAPDAAIAQTKQVLGGEYDDIAIGDFINAERRSDSLAAIIIGNAEGTRTPNGGKTRHYNQHPDPGNTRENRGSFSLQGATNLSPEEADRVQQQRMAKQIPAYTAACKAAGLAPTNAIVLANYFDMYNIKPALATTFGALLPELAAKGVSLGAAIELRLKASQQTQPRAKWSGWEKIARERLRKKDAQISDAEFWQVVRQIHTHRAEEIRNAMTALGIRHPGKTSKTKTPTPSPTPTPTPEKEKPTTDPRSYRLTGSVGVGGDNQPADVGAVQHRLTEVGIDVGAVDQKVGPRTIAGIEKYQAGLGMKPDGLIEVGKKTERSLFGVGGLRAVVDVHIDGSDKQPSQKQQDQNQQQKPQKPERPQPQVQRRDGMYMVGGYPSSRPAGNLQPVYKGPVVTGTLPNGIKVNGGVEMSPAILRGALVAARYLPRTAHITSGIRTDAHQARVIIDKAGGLVDGDLWKSYLKANGGDKAKEVAWVGNSKHRAGLAFDVAGASFADIIRAVATAKREHPEAGLHDGYVERKCVHVAVDP